MKKLKILKKTFTIRKNFKLKKEQIHSLEVYCKKSGKILEANKLLVKLKVN